MISFKSVKKSPFLYYFLTFYVLPFLMYIEMTTESLVKKQQPLAFFSDSEDTTEAECCPKRAILSGL